MPGLAGFAQLQGLAQAPQPTAPPEAHGFQATPEVPETAPEQPQPMTAFAPAAPEPPAPEVEEVAPEIEDAASQEMAAPILTPAAADAPTPPLPEPADAAAAEAPSFEPAAEPSPAEILTGLAQSDEQPAGEPEIAAAETPLDDVPSAADAELVPEAPPAIPEDAAAAPEAAQADAYAGELQAFEAHYEQHPEIPLGAFDDATKTGAQAYFQDQEQADADFLEDEMSPENLPIGKRAQGRKLVMVSGSLAGALVLGGAIAFAYKQTGEAGAGVDQPPLIQADSRPVKVAPKQPGGKQFPHKNKLIYDRLVGEERAEVERVVLRQEEVADGSAPGADQEARVAVATNPQSTGSTGLVTDAAPDATGGPRKVKTLVVRPDGTILQPAQPAQVDLGPATAALRKLPEKPAAAAPAPAAAAPAQPKPTASAPQKVAAVQPTQPAAPVQPANPAPIPTPKPKAKAKPKPTREARAPASSGGGYVVQVAARKSQTGALAAFADLQQRYPKLLSGYRPMIQRADLGNKGTWYRLRVGPMEQKTAAASLCKKLRSAGMRSCLVRSQ